MPEGSGERAPKIGEISYDFDSYAGEQVARFNGLSTFLTESLAIVETIKDANTALEQAGRPDLAITEREEMITVDSPELIREPGANFTANFIMYTDRIEAPEGSHEGPTLVPVTKEEIEAWRKLPKITSYAHEKELEESGDFVFPFNASHISKGAFLRMLVLFPDFTKDLITRMSNLRNDTDGEVRFEAELFVAYQLMARLVDKNDPDVEHTGNEPDSWYLYR